MCQALVTNPFHLAIALNVRPISTLINIVRQNCSKYSQLHLTTNMWFEN